MCAMLLGPFWVLGNQPGTELPRRALKEPTKYLLPGDQLSMKFALTSSCISAFLKTVKLLAQRPPTNGLMITFDQQEELFSFTIPLGVLVRAAVNLKTISRLLASLRHGEAGPASWPCAWREPGCFWNGSRLVLVSGTAHCSPARPR